VLPESRRAVLGGLRQDKTEKKPHLSSFSPLFSANQPPVAVSFLPPSGMEQAILLRKKEQHAS
jgi:hypothetical protein